MMVQYCCVPLCKSNAFTPGISLHSLPKNEVLRKHWIISIRRNEKYSKVSDSMRVCSLHFLPSDYSSGGLKIRRLKKDAVPSVFNFSSTCDRSPHDGEARHKQVCELHLRESDFATQATGYDSKKKKTLSYELKIPRLNESAVSTLFMGSHNFCHKRRIRKETLAERHHRLKFEKLQRAVKMFLKENGYSQKDFDLINDKFEILVPVELAGSKTDQFASSSSNDKVWKDEEVTALIALYQSEKCLYDQAHPFFHNEEKRIKAYCRIQTSLANMHLKCSIEEIKDQINTLLNQYISEKIVKDNIILAGHVTENSYEPQMWCFGLLQFLDEYMILTSTEDSDKDLFEENNCDFRNSLEKSVSSEDVRTNTNSDERDNIFGEYIASEMRFLKQNTSLYLKTMQAIMDVLRKANSNLVNSE